VQPGTTAAHQYAESNIALLLYVVQTAIAQQPSVVNSASKTVWALIQQEVVAPLNLGGTFLLLPDGAVPYRQFQLNGVAANRPTLSATARVESDYLGGSHMVYTTAVDMQRVLRSLLASDGTFQTVGTTMTSAPVTVGAAEARPGVALQGLGLVGLDVTALCARWAAASTTTSTLAACPLADRAGAAFGFVSPAGVGAQAAALSVCTALASSATATGLTCSAAVGVRQATSTTGIEPSAWSAALFAATTEALAQSTITYSDPGGWGGDIVTPDSSRRTAAYGWALFGCLMALLCAVLLITYMTELVITPMPLTGKLSLPAYPTLQIIPEQQGGGIRDFDE
jgi:hypothetical protein